jgi:flagellar basal-body rod modification protein FlgD
MAVAPVSSSTSSTAAFGLDFQSLLNIILQQLTYQDPLKPVDNFEFVSQLGQFAQLQQTQSLNDQITNLLASQSATQATGLLGQTVGATTNGSSVIGQVTSITFSSGQPLITITTSDGVFNNISIADISLIEPTTP